MVHPGLARPAVVLGYLGLAPQAACLALATLSDPFRWASMAAAAFYAAVILSFLGGMWWMAGVLSDERRATPYVLAILPSLIAWASTLPWVFGAVWPGPSLFILGSALLLSPLCDRAISRRIAHPAGWLSLRVRLASGLGILTLAMAAI